MIRLIWRELMKHLLFKIFLLVLIVAMSLVATAEANLFDDLMILFVPFMLIFNFYITMLYRIARKEDFILRNLPIKVNDIIKSLYLGQLVIIFVKVFIFLSIPAIIQYFGEYYWNINLDSIAAGIGIVFIVIGVFAPIMYLLKEKAQMIYWVVFIFTMTIMPKGRFLVDFLKNASTVIFILGIIIFGSSYIVSQSYFKKYEQ
ncbi:MAG: ABC-2 transporter permease [Tissierellales bacterium]|jgi:hypothetical protein|nr:ABC-2 transporter permease [Tissierellales bacterium]